MGRPLLLLLSLLINNGLRKQIHIFFAQDYNKLCVMKNLLLSSLIKSVVCRRRCRRWWFIAA